MKTVSLSTVLFVSALCSGGTMARAAEHDIDSMPPVVVKTVPESGSSDVPPGVTDIKVTFSKDMTDGSWSWSTAWAGSTPDIIGKPSYESDHRTCVLKAKLEPNKTYAYWLNSEKFLNFKDTAGHPAVPYLLVFQTAPVNVSATQAAAQLEAEVRKAQQTLLKFEAKQFLAAIANKDDKKLKELCSDHIRGWKDAAPIFATEMRQHFEKTVGKPFDMEPAEALTGGENQNIAVVKCTGPADLKACLLVYLGKTADGWKIWSTHNAAPDVDLVKNLLDFLNSDPIRLPKLAAVFVDQLSDGRFNDATKSFDEPMQKALPPDKLRKVWTDLADAGGKYLGTSGDIQIKPISEYTAAFVATRWEKQSVDLKIVFTKDHHISGLWIVKPGDD